MDIKQEKNFENIEFTEIHGIKDISLKTFFNCKFTDCDFTESNFSNSLFADCIFKTSNLSLIKLTDSKLQNVYFDDCKILGVDFTQISKFIVKLGFRNSQISNCNFSTLDLKNSDFLNSQIIQSDFYKTNLSKSNFSGSDLKGTIFNNTDLTKADLKNAKNYAIDPLSNKIKQAEFTMPDAIGLLDPLQVKIYW